MANHDSFLELLVDAAVEVPSKPGTFSMDAQAMRTLLFELVRQQKPSGDATSTSLKASNEKLMQEVSGLQFYVKQLEKKMDQLSSLFNNVSRLEEVIGEIRENERIISESTNLLMADVEAAQDQLDALQHGDISTNMKGLPPGVAASDLLERIEALETRTLSKKVSSDKKPSSIEALETRTLSKKVSSDKKSSSAGLFMCGLQTNSRKGGARMSLMKKKYSNVDEVRFNLTSLSDKLTEPLPLEPKPNMNKPFLDLKDNIQALGMERVTAIEDFLSGLKASVSIQPKMLQELMIIFSSMEVDFFSLLVHAMNDHANLTVSVLTEILDLLLTSPCNPQALVALYSLVAADPPRLSLTAFCTMLNFIKDATKVTPIGFSQLLSILMNCEGLMQFLNGLTELESWSWDSMFAIVEELHFSKNSTLLELVVVMEKMSESELNELMCMLLTIPGYVNELMHSLPHTPSISTQRLLEHLISLPGDSPSLLAQAVALMVSSSEQKDNILQMMRRLLELTSTLESDTRSSDCGFYQLLKMLHKAEDITLTDIGEMLSLLCLSDAFTLEAVRALVQFSRDSNNDFVGAWQSLLLALMECPAMKGDLIQRTARLLEKAKFVSPRHIEELFVIMQQSGLLRSDNFDPVIEVFRESELNNAYNLAEFFSMVKNLDFLTLEDLGHVLEQNQAASKHAYEEALERHNRRIQEFKEAEDREAVMQETTELAEEEVEEEDEEAKETKQEIGTDQLATPQSPSDNISQSPSDVTPQQVTGVESGLVHELQKEIKELRAILDVMMHDRSPRRSGQEKEKKKRPSDKKKKERKEKKQGDASSFEAPKKEKKQGDASSFEAPKKEKKQGDASSFEAFPTSSASGECSAELPVTKSQEDKALKDSSSGSVSLQLWDHYSSDHLVIESELREEIDKLRLMMDAFSDHEKECKERYQWLSDMVSDKAETEELARFQAAVKRQLHNFIHKTPTGPAGAKQQVAVNCISCDQKSMMNTRATGQALPVSGAFPPVLSQRPHRVYEMDLIRRHARSLLNGSQERVDLYSIPRSCGGQHTSVDVRQTWTYEIHQKESCVRDGKMFNNNAHRTKSKSSRVRASNIDYMPHAPSQP